MEAADILNDHHLKRTSCREGIINVIIAAHGAISENDIKARLDSSYDRTTFYRSFKTLEKNNVIHKVIIDSQNVKYALSHHHDRQESHAHFYCQKCHTVQCLNEINVQNIQLPDGYSGDEAEVIIKGTCPDCQKENAKD